MNYYLDYFKFVSSHRAKGNVIMSPYQREPAYQRHQKSQAGVKQKQISCKTQTYCVK